MDHSRFDAITKGFAAPSRRSLLTLAGGAALAALLGHDERGASAKPKKKCKKPKAKCGKKCINLKTDAQNCGICGKKCGAGQTCSNGNCVGGGCGPGLRDCGAAGCRECCNSTDCCPSGRPNCLEADGNRARTCTAAGVCACAGEYPYYCDALGVGAPMCWDCCESPHCLIDPFYQERNKTVCSFGNCDCADGETFCAVIGAGNPPRCTNTKTDNNNCGGCGVDNPPLHNCTASGKVCVAGSCTSP